MSYKDPDKERAHRAGYYKTHSEEVKARSRKWYWANLERARKRMSVYRANHKEEHRAYDIVYREKHREKFNAQELARYYKLKFLEMSIIAQFSGDDVPRCRADLTPELLQFHCLGALQIDHINGGGHKERSWNRIRGVVNGTRELYDLRVLCELHQSAYAILRGDSVGGSDPKDWEE